MTYMAINELKKSKALWEALEREQELVITRDGKPAAIMMPVAPDNVEEALIELRRIRFSQAVSKARSTSAGESIPDPTEIQEEITRSRRERGKE